MSDSAVCRVTGRRPECGDRVEVRLVKSLVGATNWRVEEILRVQQTTVQEDEDERSSCDESGPDLSHSKLVCLVTGLQGGSVQLQLPSGYPARASLAGAWQQTFLPAAGDCVVVQCLGPGRLSRTQLDQAEVVGLAPVSGMCRPTASCTVNEGRHFESVYVMAHEIGHK